MVFFSDFWLFILEERRKQTLKKKLIWTVNKKKVETKQNKPNGIYGGYNYD